jgi:hypothetical protein
MTETMDDLRKARRINAAKRILAFVKRDGNLTDEDWLLWVVHLQAELTERERAALVMLLLRTFTPDEAESVIQAAFKGAGWPLPTLGDGDHLADARMWAEDASPKEVSAWGMACVDRMPKSKLAKFVEWAKGRLEARG